MITKSQKKRAESLKKTLASDIYMSSENKALFLAWIAKKEKYEKIYFSETEKNVLQNLDRIKKIYRRGLNRVYMFISDRWNHQKSFYLCLNGRDNIDIRKDYPAELIPKKIKKRSVKK